jgi:mitochondrial import inner membrane translocase subunit TIM22
VHNFENVDGFPHHFGPCMHLVAATMPSPDSFDGATSPGNAPFRPLWKVPEGVQKPPPWLQAVNSATESCLFKGALSATAGSVLGVGFGLFFGGYANAVDKAVELQGPTSAKLRVGFREAGLSMRSYAKQFAIFGAVFSTSECTVEKIRARHDLYNSVIAGCATGAILASQPTQSIPARARASQMAVGCAGMSAFSAAIDYYMEYWD